MRSNIRLVEEINKLVANILSRDGGVTLPSVGSLVIVAGDDDQPRTIIFSTDENQRSVVEVIASRGNCSEGQALKLYEKWLGEVREGESVTIDNIGVIADGAITLNDKMADRLNPASKFKRRDRAQEEPAKEEQPPKVEEPKEEIAPARRRGRGVIVVVVLLALMVAGYIIYDRCGGECGVVVEAPQEEVVELVAEPVVEPVAEPIAEAVVEVTPVEVEEEEENEEEREASVVGLATKAGLVKYREASAHLDKTIARSTATKRFRVVCGVLKYRGNAGRLILDIEERTAGMGVECRAYPYCGHYMITIYESNSLSACYNFLRSSVGNHYDSMWVYDSRR